jgi:hypothetical protein
MNQNVTDILRTLPKKLKLGAYDWKIALQDESAEGEFCGLTEFEIATIHIWPKQLNSADHAVGIVLHEILHVIWDNHDLKNSPKSDDQEEEIIVAYEQGLVSLFRDNPKLLTWLRRGLK